MQNGQMNAEVNRERYTGYQREAAMDRLANEVMRNRPAHARRTSIRRIITWIGAILSRQATTVQGWRENGGRLAH